MQTTVAIDDDLLAEAKAYTGITETPDLVKAAIKALMEREAARRMILLQGTEPDLRMPRRRRSQPKKAS